MKSSSPQTAPQSWLASIRSSRTWVLLGSIAFFAVGMVLLYFQGEAAGTDAVLGGALVRFSFIGGMAWIAWPQIMWFADRKIGLAGVAIAIAGVMVLIVRPRAAIALWPALASLLGVLVTLAYISQWLNKWQKPRR